jgi:hypothetical protein
MYIYKGIRIEQVKFTLYGMKVKISVKPFYNRNINWSKSKRFSIGSLIVIVKYLILRLIGKYLIKIYYLRHSG